MGTWDWDLTTNTVEWSDNLARMHGLPENTFDEDILDERDSRELLAGILERHGAIVTQCESADGVIAAVKSGRVDLLVADIAMPDVDGYQLLSLVRQQSPQLPAVAVSAYARPEDRAKALTSGFAGYCVKPLEASLFVDAVATAMNEP